MHSRPDHQTRSSYPFYRRARTWIYSGLWRSGLFLILLAWGSLSLPAHAHSSIEPLSTIRHQAVSFALAQARSAYPAAKINTRSVALDRQLRLAYCPRLNTTTNQSSIQSGTIVVKVTCPGQWKIYVPVSIIAKIPVLVLNTSITRGTPIQRSMLQRQWTNLTNLSYGYYTNSKGIIGQDVSRNVSEGTVVTPSLLQAPLWIHRNQQVKIEVKTQGFSVSAKGIALQNAREGGVVNVKNMSSGRIVQGTATAPGIVRITP